MTDLTRNYILIFVHTSNGQFYNLLLFSFVAGWNPSLMESVAPENFYLNSQELGTHSSNDRHNQPKRFRKIHYIVHDISFAELALTRFCEKSCGTSVDQMTEHLTGNRKDLGSIPRGVEVFLFSQKISPIILKYFHLVLRDLKIISKLQVGKVDKVEFCYHVE